jgi:hypothetical protein
MSSSITASIVIIVAVVAFITASAGVILWVAFAAMRRVKQKSSSGREGFSQNHHVVPWNAEDVTLPLGANLDPAAASENSALRDMVKLRAVRPYHVVTDAGKSGSDYAYHVEMNDNTFKAVLAHLYDTDKKKRRTASTASTDSTLAAWNFETVSTSAVPSDVRFILIGFLQRELNGSARKIDHPHADASGTDNPFVVTIMHVDAAKVGIKVSEDKTSIFDQFHVECTACFHRSGKRFGHCARFECLVDTDTGQVEVSTPPIYAGVIPEDFAAADATSVQIHRGAF